MNAQRRKEIAKIIESLEKLKPEIEGVIMDEEQAKDDMHESLQRSGKYEGMEQALWSLGQALYYVDEVSGYLKCAKEN